MRSTIDIPTTPSDWIEMTPIVIEEGCYPSCTVIRNWNEVTPFVVHTAYIMEGKWCYTRGFYCRTMEEAQAAYAERARC